MFRTSGLELEGGHDWLFVSKCVCDACIKCSNDLFQSDDDDVS